MMDDDGGQPAPRILGIAEAVLYTDDLAESRAFFEDGLGLPVIFEAERVVGFHAGTSQVLLVFDRAHSMGGADLPGGHIPGHRGEGPAHLAFHVSMLDYEAWKRVLPERGITITSEVLFDAGGKSLYFEDPDGNVLELATPGHWRTF